MEEKSLLKQKKLFLRSYWWVGFSVPALIIVAVLLVTQGNKKVGPAQNGPTKKDTTQSVNKKPSTNFPACGKKMDFFTVSPIKSDDYGALIPLGNLNPTGHVFPTDHIYLFSKQVPDNGKASEALAKPLYSPGYMWITDVSTSEDVGSGITDYSIGYQPCDEFRGKFGHVGRLSTRLKAEIEKTQDHKCDEYTTGGSKFRACSYNQLKISVKAGEELGTAFNGRSAALDIWATDYRIKRLEFANPSRWREESFFNACPANYFTSSIKSEMLGRFSDYDGNKRTIEPVCGTIEVDVKGTAKGYWFTRDHTPSSSEDKNMALANDNKNPLKQAFSMGNSGESKGFKSGVYFFTPKESGNLNRDFAAVSSNGSVYCYETTDSPSGATYGVGQVSVLYLSLINGETIRVEKTNRSVCGSGPWTLTNYVEFVR